MVLFSLAAAIAVILFLSFKKSPLALSLTAATVVMAFLNGKFLLFLGNCILRTLTDPKTFSMIAIIVLITVLSYVMQKFSLLESMVSSLEDIVRSSKIAIMLAPAIMGMLLVTGGAYISCPVVDSLGDKLGLDSGKKAAVNLIFRHGMYFLFPIAPTIILASELSGISVWTFIKIQLPIPIVLYCAGYFLFLFTAKSPRLPKITRKEYFKSLGSFFLYSFPIIISVLIPAFSHCEFYVSLAIGIVSAFLIHYLQEKYKEEQKCDEPFYKILYQGINWKLVSSMLAILFFKTVVTNLDAVTASIKDLIASGMPLEFVVIAASALTSYLMGTIQPAMALLYPIVLPLVSPAMAIFLACIIYTTGFLFYYTSPVHLCQVVTLEYFSIKLSDLYKKQYYLFLTIVSLTSVVFYTLYRFLIL